MRMSYRIVLEKEAFKFSCSHFTIFGPGRAERLHGHNYHVVTELKLTKIDPDLGMAFDFNLIKPLIREETQALDEHVLLPSRSPHLKIDAVAGTVRAHLGVKHYSFPVEDVKILPVVNITSEELACYFAQKLAGRLRATPEAIRYIESMSVGVQETRGQTVFYDWNFADTSADAAEEASRG
jgi:6-pyruvoyltetrahydropterin/6-carboxytetrahydropterin synthase